MSTLRFRFVYFLFSFQFLPSYQISDLKSPVPFSSGESNEWESFIDWGRSSPNGTQHSAATTVLKRTPTGRQHEVMLLYGGVTHNSDNTTWLYEPNFRTWTALETAIWPPASSHHTLVTLCQSRVILFGGAYGRKSADCVNETWAFELGKDRWTRVLHAGNDSVPPRCSHTATVFRRNSSLCSCKDSMVVYSGLPKSRDAWSNGIGRLGDIWELQCVSDSSYDRLVYRWVRLISRGSKLPNLQFPQLVSVYDKTKVYLYGKYRSEGDFTKFFWNLWSFEEISDNEIHWCQVGPPSEFGFEGAMVYLTDEGGSFHFLVPCCDQPLIVFDLGNKSWFRPRQIPYQGELPLLDFKSFAVVAIRQSLLAFGGSQVFFGFHEHNLWNLTFHTSNICVWSSSLPQPKNPLEGMTLSLGGAVGKRRDAAIVFGGIGFNPVTNQLQYTNDIYRLNFDTLQWSVDPVDEGPPHALGATGCILYDSVLIMFGGARFSRVIDWEKVSLIQENTWGYYSNEKIWIKYELKTQPNERAFATSVTLQGSQTMIIFGGGYIAYSKSSGPLKGRLQRLRDLWSFNILPPTTNHLAVAKSGAEWRMLNAVGPKNSLYGSLASIGKKLFLYGGNGENDDFFGLTELISRQKNGNVIRVGARCVDNLWEYNLETNIWKELDYTGHGPGRRCAHNSVVYDDHLIVFGGCSNYVEINLNTNTLVWSFICTIEESSTGLWSYSPVLGTWLRHSQESATSKIGLYSLTFVWKQWILSFGGINADDFNLGEVASDRAGFSFFRPTCPPGNEASNSTGRLCSPCGVGYYSEHSDSRCQPCPSGLTTLREGSTSIDDCNLCERGYCVHGSCTASIPGSCTASIPGPSPLCECHVGFTKNNEGRCTLGLYFVAGAGFVAGTVLLIVVVTVIFRYVRARKRHKAIVRNKDEKIVELAQGWNVDSREVRLRRRIDGNSPGGFGDVYLAEYRELTVAVKKLKGIHQSLQRLELEFEREIEVMRSIRHPNIVLFLGGGRYHDDGCPFLVIEYMARGSLASILKSSKVPLDNRLKMRFALDTAKGMRFLHNLRPPRVHRDLKSGNLLVSERWVVKVGDFGTARLVRDEGVNQDAVRGESPLDYTVPLLRPESHLSSGVGTPSWSSPEVLRASAYGTPTDVYSFGIVLWEILTRREPYYDRRFRSVLDLSRAIDSGVRPTILPGLNDDCVRLMQECWDGVSTARPTFGDVASRLENINERLLLLPS